MLCAPSGEKPRSPTIDIVLWTIAVIFFIQGAVWRWVDVFYIQSPVHVQLSSDMATYHWAAKRWANSWDNPAIYRPNIGDLSRPPGPDIFYGSLFLLDKTPEFRIGLTIIVLMSAAVPLLVGAIGYELYGLRVALIASSITSLYFPALHYSCFLLSEPLIIYFIPLSLWLLVRSIRVQRTWLSALIGYTAGVSIGATIAIKPAVGGPAVLVFVYLLATAGACSLRSWRGSSTGYSWQRLLLVVGASSLGLIALITPLSIRATRLNEGNFCVLSRNGPHNVLMGHYGHHRIYRFVDRKRGISFGWGNPADIAAGYNQDVQFDFGPYESDKVMAEAKRWIKANPWFAMELSCQSVGRLFRDAGEPIFFKDWTVGDSQPQFDWRRYFRSSTAFPLAQGEWQGWAVDFYNWLYLVFILLPAVAYVVHNSVARLRQGKGLLLGDMLLTLPLVGTMIVCFCTLGETRTRIPYDTLMIILAAKAYVNIVGELRSRGRAPGEVRAATTVPDKSVPAAVA